MRVFTGIGLPQPILKNLDRVLDKLRPTADIGWSPLENLHITTKFVGHWPDERLDEIEHALARLPSRPVFDIEIRGLGWFPNPRSPRVFLAAIHGGASLQELARDTERALADLGIAVEGKAYSPHLTLARIKAPSGLTRLRQIVEALPSDDLGRFPVDRFLLYRSVPGPKGSKYSVLAEFPL